MASVRARIGGAAAVLILLAWGMAACGSDGDSSAPTTAPAPGQSCDSQAFVAVFKAEAPGRNNLPPDVTNSVTANGPPKCAGGYALQQFSSSQGELRGLFQAEGNCAPGPSSACAWVLVDFGAVGTANAALCSNLPEGVAAQLGC